MNTATLQWDLRHDGARWCPPHGMPTRFDPMPPGLPAATADTDSETAPRLLRLAADPAQWYLLQPPPRPDPDARLLVSVHGVTRNALEHAQAFSGAARAHGCALLVPLFDERRHRRYQRLGHERHAPRADLALQAMLAEARARLRLRERPLLLFGYSGGGQFAHRYAMLYPEQVARVAVGAAGWYTFPDPARPYPFGLGGTGARGLPPARLEALLRVPAAVFVGERDCEHDAQFNASPQLVEQQGDSRLARGRAWITHMTAMARARGLDTPYRFAVLPDSDHSFARCVRRGGLGGRVIEFLMGAR